MSAGVFNRSSYLSTETGEVHPIRVQSETEALTIAGVGNIRPATPITSPISARVSGSRRTLGLSARRVRIAWTEAPPDGYKPAGVITLPWLDAATFPNLVAGLEGTYLGASVVVVGKSPETLR